MRKHILKIIFILLVTLSSLAYVIFIQLKGGVSYIESESNLSELGEFLGSLGYFFLILVYTRTALKLIVVKKYFWQKLEPLEIDYSQLKSFLEKLLYFFNKAHAYFGTLTIVAIFMHCYLTSSFLDNLLLRLVLVLLAWQGIFGAFMQFKYTPASLKRKSYLFHAQLITGLLILILAGFGHLLMGD